MDPDLTLSLPPSLTASTGLDALTQLIEGFLTARANPVTDALALEGIGRSARSLPRAVADGSDPAAREELALASLLGGLVLANAGLGAVHGIAAPLGGRHPVPHGVACARLLPHVFRANLEALRDPARGGAAGGPAGAASLPAPASASASSATAPAPRREGAVPGLSRDRAGETLGRMARVGVLLGENVDADLPSGAVRTASDDAERAALILDRLVAGCAVPGLATFGVTRADVRSIAEASLRASSMKGNPVPLELARIEAAITAAL